MPNWNCGASDNPDYREVALDGFKMSVKHMLINC
jgi:hypothetical protein